MKEEEETILDQMKKDLESDLNTYWECWTSGGQKYFFSGDHQEEESRSDHADRGMKELENQLNIVKSMKNCLTKVSLDEDDENGESCCQKLNKLYCNYTRNNKHFMF